MTLGSVHSTRRESAELFTEYDGLLPSPSGDGRRESRVYASETLPVMRLLYPPTRKSVEKKLQKKRLRPRLQADDPGDAPNGRKHPHTWLYSMLNPSSVRPQAEMFKFFITTCIFISIVSFIVESCPHSPDLDLLFYSIEGVTSSIFMVEYTLRFFLITQNHHYRNPLWGRLRYAISFPAIIDLTAFLPFMVELLVMSMTGAKVYHGERDLPNLGFLRVLRISQILKTRYVANSMKVLGRVLKHNSQVMLVAFFLCSGLMLLQATMLFYFRPPQQTLEDPSDFESIPATMYLSVLMITTLKAPSGDFPWYTKLLISTNALTSVALLAIPTSMLTWGFEAEAQRVAMKHELKQEREGGTTGPLASVARASRYYSCAFLEESGSSSSDSSCDYEDIEGVSCDRPSLNKEFAVTDRSGASKKPPPPPVYHSPFFKNTPEAESSRPTPSSSPTADTLRLILSELRLQRHEISLLRATLDSMQERFSKLPGRTATTTQIGSEFTTLSDDCTDDKSEPH